MHRLPWTETFHQTELCCVVPCTMVRLENTFTWLEQTWLNFALLVDSCAWVFVCVHVKVKGRIVCMCGMCVCVCSVCVCPGCLPLTYPINSCMGLLWITAPVMPHWAEIPTAMRTAMCLCYCVLLCGDMGSVQNGRSLDASMQSFIK